MLELPRLRDDQRAVALHPAKVKVLSCGRRWGKTVLGGRVVMEVLRQHGKVAWVTPTFKNSRPLWRWSVQVTAPAVKARRMNVSKTERTIETNRGGLLALFSGDNIDAIRGEAFHCVVMDEAARLPEDAWTDAIMPTLADYDGDAILISTPKGKNWFWLEWLKGQEMSAEYASWQAPTSDNPMPSIRRAFEKVRDRVPEDTYRQEWLAEFIEGGTVFRRIREAATATRQDNPIAGHAYVFGVDWGKHNDWTVITVLDITDKSAVYVDRFNQIDYTLQAGRLKALAQRFQPVSIIAESNSIGEPVIEQLRRDGLPVTPFQTTNATKAAAIDALALAFEQDAIKIINDPVMVGELQAYEMERLPSGLLRYSAPEGMHDDCVMSLAIGWTGVTSTPWLLW